MQVRCPRCGRRDDVANEATPFFCSGCGYQILGQWRGPSSTSRLAGQSGGSPSKTPKKGIIIILVAILLGSVGLYYIIPGPPNIAGNQPTTIDNTTGCGLDGLNCLTTSQGAATTNGAPPASAVNTGGGGSRITDYITLDNVEVFGTQGGPISCSWCGTWQTIDSPDETYALYGSFQGEDTFQYSFTMSTHGGGDPNFQCWTDSMEYQVVSGTSIDWHELTMTSSPNPSGLLIPPSPDTTFTTSWLLGYSMINGQPINSAVNILVYGHCN